MKLNRLWSLLKQRKCISIAQGVVAQWVGDGYSLYPIYNLPKLGERVMQTLLDINDDAWDKFTVKEDDELKLSEEDIVEGQIDLSPLDVELHYRGMDLIPLIGGGKIYYIQSKYLKPFENALLLSYAYRKDSGVIAVNEGLILSAFIMPVDVFRDKKFAETLYISHLRLYESSDESGR